MSTIVITTVIADRWIQVPGTSALPKEIQIHGGLFLNIQAGNADHNDKQYRNNQCKPLETAPFHFSCSLRIS